MTHITHGKRKFFQLRGFLMSITFSQYKYYSSFRCFGILFQSIFVNTWKYMCGFSIWLWNWVGRLKLHKIFQILPWYVGTERQVSWARRARNEVSSPHPMVGVLLVQIQTQISGGVRRCTRLLWIGLFSVLSKFRNRIVPKTASISLSRLILVFEEVRPNPCIYW